MAAIVDVILPIFAVLLAGYVAARLRVFDGSASHVLSRFVYYSAVPALIFISLSRTEVSDFFNFAYLGAVGGGMAVTLCFSLLFAARVFLGSQRILDCTAWRQCIRALAKSVFHCTSRSTET